MKEEVSGLKKIEMIKGAYGFTNWRLHKTYYESRSHRVLVERLYEIGVQNAWVIPEGVKLVANALVDMTHKNFLNLCVILKDDALREEFELIMGGIVEE